MNLIRLLTTQSITIALLAVTACSSYAAGGPLSASAAPYFAVNEKSQVYFPEARMRGSIAQQNGCIVIRRDGDGMLFTPVFPVVSSLEGDGVRVNGMRVRFGRVVAIGGGQITLPDYSEVSLSRIPPPACPALIWVVSNLKEI